jgi:hypothetical protein
MGCVLLLRMGGVVAIISVEYPEILVVIRWTATPETPAIFDITSTAPK